MTSTAANRSRRNRFGPGFTLVELLAVVAIIGVMMVLMVPAFQGMGKGSKINASVMQLRATFSLARQWAITQRTETYVVFPAVDLPVSYGTNKADVLKALRSFAVWTEKHGWVREWTTLQPGVRFAVAADGVDPNTAITQSYNMLDKTKPMVFSVPFPGAKVDNFAVMFRPDGRIQIRDPAYYYDRPQLIVTLAGVTADSSNGTVRLEAGDLLRTTAQRASVGRVSINPNTGTVSVED